MNSKREKEISVLHVRPGRKPTRITIENKLETMQQLVGGNIEECMPFQDDVAIICNEEGKLNHLPLNRAIYDEETGQMVDIIAGDFFICYAPAWSENFRSLPDDLANKYAEKFQYPERFYRMGGKLVASQIKPRSMDFER